MSPFMLKRLWRRPILLSVSVLFCALFCSLLCYLFGYMELQRQELDQVQESYDVLCVVSDVRGSSTTGLRMRGDYLMILSDPSVEGNAAAYVRDFQLTKEFSGQWAEAETEEGAGAETGNEADGAFPVIGLTNQELAASLDESMGAHVTWLWEGDFYGSGEPVCLVSEQLYAQLSAEQPAPSGPGPVLSLTLEDPMYPEVEPVPVELTAVGVYQGTGETVYLPWDYARQLMEDWFGAVSCDSMRFYVRDNRQIAQLSALASQWFQPVDIQGGDTIYQYALTIYDEQYLGAVTALQQNIRRSQYIIPVLLLLVVLAGSLISFLAIRSARRSYALMRVQGLSRMGLLATAMAELALMAAGGCVLAAALWRQWLPVVIFLACYLLGGLAAAIRPVLARPSVVLRQQE